MVFEKNFLLRLDCVTVQAKNMCIPISVYLFIFLFIYVTYLILLLIYFCLILLQVIQPVPISFATCELYKFVHVNYSNKC